MEVGPQLKVSSAVFWRDLTISHCISGFELCESSLIWLIPFNSHAPVLTQLIKENRKKSNFLKFTISLLVNIFRSHASSDHIIYFNIK